MPGFGNRKVGVGGLLLLIGAAMLVASLLSVWYTASLTTTQGVSGGSTIQTGHSELKPGSSYTSSFSSTSSSCISGVSDCNTSESANCAYSGGGGSLCSGTLNRTGQLYLVTEFIVIGAIVLGLIGGVLALLSPGKSGVRKRAVALGILAMLLALIAPMTLLGLQPGAIKSDIASQSGPVPPGHPGRMFGVGPYSSFFGSCTNSSGNCLDPGVFPPESGSWGPSTGWYLSLGASGVFLVGAILILSAKRGVASLQSTSGGQPDVSTGRMAPEPPLEKVSVR